MQRILLSSLFLVLAQLASAATVRVGTVAAECGKAVVVPVSVDLTSGALAIEFSIGFDSSKVAFEGATAAGITSGFSLASNVSGSSLRIAMASGTPANGSGVIANVTFRIGSAVSGAVPLTIANVAINDVATANANGRIDVTCSTGGGGAGPCTACTPSSSVACMLGGRFNVTMAWVNRFQSPALSGSGKLINYAENRPATDPKYGAMSEVAYFSMYSWAPTSVEAIVRIINGVGINDKIWVYMTGFSNSEYTVTVLDTKTCTTWARTNAHGSFGMTTDQAAFPLQ